MVFAIIIALLILRRRDDNEWRPKTQLTFLGFINTNAGSPCHDHECAITYRF